MNRGHDGDPRYWAVVVGLNVRRLRSARGITQRRLSYLMGRRGRPMAQSRISCLERDAKVNGTSYVVVDVDLVMTLADVIGVPYLRLLDETVYKRRHDW